MIVVLYHGNCYDGFGAAWVARQTLGEDGVKFIPVAYNKPIPDEAFQASAVFILDFSYPRDQLIQLADRTRVVVLDHHVTAQKDLEGLSHPNLEIRFDMNRSGAGLTWDFFHSVTPRPRLIDMIEDRDLWKFKIEGSKELHAALVSYPLNFELWDKFDVDLLIKEGVALTRMYQQLVEKICQKPWMQEIGGYVVPVVNTSIAWSEVGEYLVTKYPDSPFVASFTEFHDVIMWSLRSKGDFDVSEIAKKYNGGGHRNAAGFKIPKGRANEIQR